MASQREIIVELIPRGKFVKATAVDVKTGREVSIVGAASASEQKLKALAVQKLEYVLTKEQNEKTVPSTKPRGIEV